MIISGKIAIAAGVAGAMLVAALAWQTHQRSQAEAGQATADATLSVCRDLNSEIREQIHDINEQADRDAARAEAARARADEAEQRAQSAERERRETLQATRAELADAVAGNDCAAEPAPGDLDRLFRSRAPGTD